LAEKGKYAYSISKIGKYGEGVGFAKDIDEGLVQHLMIAYFNDWIEWNNPILRQFFRDAPPKLRGKAADFLKTGFSDIRKENDAARIKEKGKRVKLYWEERLKAMTLNPKLNSDEAIEFVDWVEDTLIEPEITLKLTFETLKLTEGKLGQSRDEVNLVKGVCEIGKDNELLALQCMNKMMVGRPEWISLSIYEKELKAFLEHVIGLEDVEIRNEAKELVNAYGRRGIDNLKLYYDKLMAL